MDTTVRSDRKRRSRVSGRAFGAVAGSILLFGSALSAWAQSPPAANSLDSLSLDELLDAEVVYAASRYDQKASEAPAVVSIVSAEDIRRHGWSTLAEVVGAVRGVYTTSDRNYTYATFRGFGHLGDYNTHVLIMIDGHPLNENIGDGSYLDESFPLDLDVVERIEIIRGPSSSIYGTSAFFGVINVVTREAEAFRGGWLSAAGSSFAGRSGSATLGGVRNGLTWLASATARGIAGPDLYYPEFDDGSPGAGIVRDGDDEDARRAFARVGWRAFTLEAAWSEREKGIPTGSYGTIFGDRRSRTWDVRDFVQLRHEGKWGRETQLSSRIAYDHIYYEGHYVYDYGTPGSPDLQAFRDFWYGTWLTTESQAVRRLPRGGSLLAGAELRRNFRQDQWANDPTGTVLDDRRSSTTWAAYSSLEQPLHRRLILNCGIRHDRSQWFGGTTSPRLAAIVPANERTTVKLLFGRAFRAPNAYELYYQGGGSKAALSLEPEIIRTYDAVVDRTLWPGIVGTVSFYRYDVDDLIRLEVDPLDGQLVYRNSGSVSGNGVESELRGRLSGGLAWAASYAWQRAEDRASKVTLPNSPRHVSKMLLSMPLLDDRFGVATDWGYLSSRATESGISVAGAFVGNLALRWRPIPDRADVLLRVLNVTDEAYADPGGPEHLQAEIPRDGRTWQLKLTVTP